MAILEDVPTNTLQNNVYDTAGNALANDYTPTSLLDFLPPPTSTQKKQANLAQNTKNKENNIGFYKGKKIGEANKGFYDADSPYSVFDDGEKTSRIGTMYSDKSNLINAPESPSTIRRGNPYKGIPGREPTEQEVQAYNQSMMALDNFQAGTTPASRESWNAMKQNPLTPENQVKYDEAMAPQRKQLLQDNPLDLYGDKNKKGKYGRQIVGTYNDQYNDQESLGERLVNTGNASMRGNGGYPGSAQATTGLVSDMFGNEQDGDGRVMEDVDMAQSGAATLYSNFEEAAQSFDKWVAEKFGASEEGAKEFSEIAALENVPFTDLSVKDARIQAKADAYTGVKKATRNAFNAEMKNAEEQWANGDYGSSMMTTIKQMDRLLAQSAPEMASMMVPYVGVPLTAAARLNDQQAMFKENNNRDMTDKESAAAYAEIIATLVPEKLLTMFGFKGALNVLKGKGGVVGTVAGSTAGETAQEYSEGVQETYATQKKGEKSLGEIMTDPKQVFQGATGGLMGGSMAGTGTAAGAGVNKVATAAKKRISENKYAKLVGDSVKVTKQNIANMREEGKLADIERMRTDVQGATKNYMAGDAVNTEFDDQGNKSTVEVVTENLQRYRDTTGIESTGTDKYFVNNLIEETMANVNLVDNPDAATRIKEIMADPVLGKLVNQKGISQKLGQKMVDGATTRIDEEIAKSPDGKLSDTQKTEMKQQVEDALGSFFSDFDGQDENAYWSKNQEKAQKLLNQYIDSDGKKNMDQVSQEVFETGFITPSSRGAANITRKSLAQHEYDSMNEIFDESRDPAGMQSLNSLSSFANSRTQRFGFLAPSLLATKTAENNQFIALIDDMIKETKENVPEGERRDKIIVRLEAIKESVTSANESNAEFSKEHYSADTEKAKGDKSRFKKKKSKSKAEPKSTGSKKKKFTKPKGANTKSKVAYDENIDKVDAGELKFRSNNDNTLGVFMSQNSKAEKAGTDKGYSLIDAVSGFFKVKNGQAFYSFDIKRNNKNQATFVPFNMAYMFENHTERDYVVKNNNGNTMFAFQGNIVINNDKSNGVNVFGTIEDMQAKLADGDSMYDKEIFEGITKEHLDFLAKNDLGKDIVRNTKQKTKHSGKFADEEVETPETTGSEETTTEDATETTEEAPKTKKKKKAKQSTKEETKETPTEDMTPETVAKEGAESDLFPDTEEVNVETEVDPDDLYDYEFKTPNGKNTVQGKIVKENDERIVVEYKDPYSGKQRKTVFNTDTGDAESSIDPNSEKYASKYYVDGGKVEPKTKTDTKEDFVSKGDKLVAELDEEQKKIIEVKEPEVDQRSVYDFFTNPFLNSNVAAEDLMKYLPDNIAKKFGTEKHKGEVQKHLDFIRGIVDNRKLIDIIKTGAKSGYTSKGETKSDSSFSVNEKTGEITREGGSKFQPLSYIATGTTGSPKKGTEVFTFTPTTLEIIAMNALYSYQEGTGLAYKDEEGVARAFGLNPHSEYDQDAIKEAVTLAQEGKMPYQYLVTTTGANIFSQLGIKINNNVDKKAQEELEKALGQLAINSLVSSNMFSTLGGDYAKFKLEGQDRELNLMQVNFLGETKEENDAYLDEMSEATNVFRYLDPTIRGNLPMAEAIKDVSPRVRNDVEDKPEQAKEFNEHEQANGYKFNDLSDIILNEDSDVAREALHKIAGWKDLSKLPIHEVIPQTSINEQITRDINGLFEFRDAFIDPDTGLKIPMHVENDMTKSFRYMIDNEFNPQSSKISRFLTGSEDMIGATIPKGKWNKDNADYRVFLLGVSQGLDMDPDKQSDDTTFKEMEDLFTVGKKGVQVNTNHKMGKGLQKAIEYFQDPENGKLSDLIEIADAGEHYHAVQAAKAIADLDTAVKANGGKGTEFKHDLAIESDGITSGMALTLMQIGSPWAMNMLAKTGIYTKENQVKWQGMIDDYNKANGTDLKLDHGSLYELGQWQMKNKDKIVKPKKPETKTSLKARFLEAKGKKTVTVAMKEEFAEFVEDARTIEKAEYQQKIDDTMFADIYKTVGDGANIHMKNFITDMEQNVEAGYKSFQKDENGNVLVTGPKLAAMTLHKVAGEITRKMAKPSTMVYIYGAAIGSIMQKLNWTIGVDNLYKTMEPFQEMEATPLMSGLANLHRTQADVPANNRNETETKKKKKLSALLNGFVENKTEENRAVEIALAALDLFYGKNHDIDERAELIKFGRMTILADQAASRYNNETKTTDRSRPEYKEYKDGKVVPFEYGSGKNKRKPTFNNLILTPDMAKNMGGMIGPSYGAGFKQSFAKFKEIDGYRRNVKTMENITFAIYKKSLEKIVESVIGKKGFMTKNEQKKIEGLIRKSNLGHSMIGPYNGSKQGLTKWTKTPTGGEVGGGIVGAQLMEGYRDGLQEGVFVRDTEATAHDGMYSGTSAYIDEVNAEDNARATLIGIHAVDGYIQMMALKGMKSLNIYDAGMYAAQAGPNNQYADAYNEQTGLKSKEHSVIGNYVKRINEMVKGLESIKTMPDADGKSTIGSQAEWIKTIIEEEAGEEGSGIYDLFAPTVIKIQGEPMFEELQDLISDVDTIQKNRQKHLNVPMEVLHSYVGDQKAVHSPVNDLLSKDGNIETFSPEAAALIEALVEGAIKQREFKANKKPDAPKAKKTKPNTKVVNKNKNGKPAPTGNKENVETVIGEYHDTKFTTANGKKIAAKDMDKVEASNKYIGYGRPGSSTAAYYTAFNDEGLANLTEYTTDDVVFVSVNGGKSNGKTTIDKINKLGAKYSPVRYSKDKNYTRYWLNDKYKMIQEATDAGATIILDGPADAKRSYNIGEQALQAFMRNHGYKNVSKKGESFSRWTKEPYEKKSVKKPATKVTGSKTGKLTQNEMKDLKNKEGAFAVTQSTIDKGHGTRNVDENGNIDGVDYEYTVGEEVPVYVSGVKSDKVAKITSLNHKSGGYLNMTFDFVDPTKTPDPDKGPKKEKKAPPEPAAGEDVNAEPTTDVDQEGPKPGDDTDGTVSDEDLDIFSVDKSYYSKDNQDKRTKVESMNIRDGMEHFIMDMMLDDGIAVEPEGGEFQLTNTHAVKLQALLVSFMDMLENFDADIDVVVESYTTTGITRGKADIANQIIQIRGNSSDKRFLKTEVLAHELLHMMTEHALRADKKTRVAISKMQDEIAKEFDYKIFLDPNTKSTSSEITTAKRKFNYAVASGNPSEFLAYIATDKYMEQNIGNYKVKAKLFNNFEGEGKFPALINKFIDIINKVYDSIINDNPNERNVAQKSAAAIKGLTELGISMRQSNIEGEQDEAPGYFAKTVEKTNAINEKMEPLNKKIEEAVSWIGKHATDASKQGTFAQKISDWGVFSKIKESRFIQESWFDFSQDTSNNNDVGEFYDLYRNIKKHQEKDREDFRTNIRNVINTHLEGLDDAHKKSVKRALIDSDASYLLSNGFTLPKIKKLLEDPVMLQDAIDTEIANLQRIVGHKNTANAYTLQAEGLGYYMTNKVNKVRNQMHNASNIYNAHWAAGAMVNPVGKKKAAIDSIDKIASLTAMKYLGKESKDMAASAIGSNKTGVEMSMNIFKKHMDEANDKLFTGYVSFIVKGYNNPSTGSNLTTMVVPASEVESYEKIFRLKVIRELPETGSRVEKRYLMSSNNYEPDRTKGAMEITNYNHSGLTLRDMAMADNLSQDETDIAIDIEKRKSVGYLFSGKPVDLDAAPIQMSPLLNADGTIIDYRTEVSHQDKTDFLELDDDMASTVANTIAKSATMATGIELNEKLINWVNDDVARNYHKNPNEYVKLSPHQSGSKSKPTEMEQNWALIPQYTRDYIIKQNGKKELIIRKDMLKDIMGYSNASFGDLPFIKNNPRVRRAVMILETYWREIVARYKTIIVALTGDVVVGNLVSNMMTGMNQGIDPIKFAKDTIESWKDLDRYEEDNKNLQEAKINYKGKRTEAGKARIDALQKRLEANPAHEFIEAGLYTPIVEDINADRVLEKRNIERDLEALRKKLKMNGKGKDLMDTLYLNERSSLFRMALKLTQYSDITSRMVIKKHVPDMQMRELDQMFVNYSYNENRYLNFANSIGLLLFTKYFIRVPKAMYKIYKKNPAMTALMQGSQGVTGVDISDAYDSYYSPFEAAMNRVQNPFDMVAEVTTPNADGIIPTMGAAFDF